MRKALKRNRSRRRAYTSPFVLAVSIAFGFAPAINCHASTHSLESPLAARSTKTLITPADIRKIDFGSAFHLEKSITTLFSAFLDEKTALQLTQRLRYRSLVAASFNAQDLMAKYRSAKGKIGFDLFQHQYQLVSEIGSTFGLQFVVADTTVFQSVGAAARDPKSAVDTAFKDDVVQAQVPASASNSAGDKEQESPIWLPALGGLALAGLGSGGGAAPSEVTPLSIAFETTEYHQQYGLGAVKASTAYARGYTGAGSTVSVIDSRFDTDHPDLQGVFVTGYDALNGSSDVTCNATPCKSTHGTFVSGVIAANRNDTGMSGLAFDAKIKPIAIGSSSNDEVVPTITQMEIAFSQASGPGIVASNNSWGSSVPTPNADGSYLMAPRDLSFALDPSLKTALVAATANTIFVWASGNDGWNTETGIVIKYASSSIGPVRVGSFTADRNLPSYEGALALQHPELAGKWLTVVAVDAKNVIASYSNGCGVTKAFCIAAPGSDIYSTVDTAFVGIGYAALGGYGTASGTSFAAPHVTAALAILKQQFPNLTPTQLVDILLISATDLGPPGVDDVYGVGMLDLEGATQPIGTLGIVSGTSTQVVGDANRSFIGGSAVLAPALQGLRVGAFDRYQRAYVINPVASIRQSSDVSIRGFLDFHRAEHDTTLLHGNTFSLVSKVKPTIYGLRWSGVDFALRSARTETHLSSYRDIQPYGLLKPHIALPDFASHLQKQISTLNTAEWGTSGDGPFTLKFTSAAGRFVDHARFDDTSATIGVANGQASLQARIGLFNEHQQLLGGVSTGAFALAKPSRTSYVSLVARHAMTPNHSQSLALVRAKTRASFQHPEFVHASPIGTASFHYASEWKSVWVEQDALTFFVGQSLRPTSGTLTIHTVDGYAPDGTYRSSDISYKLKSGRTTRQIGLNYLQESDAAKHFLDVIAMSSNGSSSKPTLVLRLGTLIEF